MDMQKILKNFDDASTGKKPGAAASSANEMKAILESFNRIAEGETAVEECGAMPMGQSMPMQQGTPVSMNVSINASGKENVDDLIALMKAVSTSSNTGTAMVPSQDMDMAKMRSIVMGPEEESIEEGGMSDKAIEIEEWIKKYENHIGNNGDPLPKGYVKYFTDSGIFSDAYDQDETAKAEKMIGKSYTEWDDDDIEKALEMMPVTKAMFDDMAKIAGENSEDTAEMVADIMDNMKEEWDNSPDEQYSDHETMTQDLSGGINRRKKMFKPAAKGDNPMAVESVKDRLWAALNEKKMSKRGCKK